MNRDIKVKGIFKTLLYAPVLVTIILAAMDIALYCFDKKAGLVGTIMVAVYFIITLTTLLKNKSLVLNELVAFATNFGKTQRHLLNEFDIAYGMLDASGKMLWSNKKFASIIDKPQNYHKSVTSVIPEITREILEKGQIPEVVVSLGDAVYRAVIQKVYYSEMDGAANDSTVLDEEVYIHVVYLYDETQLRQYMKENHDMQMSVALVYIDNYDEVLESVEEVKQALLVALVDRRVNKYFASANGIVKKFDADKYLVILKQKELEKLREDKFSILEDVKTVKSGNEIDVTLSIGVGNMGKDYTQNYETARMAIDLALGRGGDQAVVKDTDKTSYYGGKARHLEKSTRVKARVKALALREIITTRDQFLVMGHSVSDVDSIGAAIGICHAARMLGKRAYIVVNNPTTSIRPMIELFTPEKGYPEELFVNSARAMELQNQNTGVIVVDTNRKNLVECPALLKSARSLVVFDHHRQCSEVIDNATLSYIEPYASSACEMIAEVLQYFDDNVKLNKEEADCIYAGILIDTNYFMTKTGVRTFEAAAFLRRHGADVERVRKMMRNGMDDYKARAEAIRNAEVYKGAFAISICPADKVESPTIACAQAANELLNIIGIKASFVMTEYNDKIYVSARSIDEINVQLVMERLGGGGHLSTAGAQLIGMSMLEAVSKIKETLDSMIEEGDIQI